MVKVNPESSFEKKPQGMGIRPLGTSSGSILKLLLFSSFCTSSRKTHFASLFILYFVLFHICIYSPRARGDNPWGQFWTDNPLSFYVNRKASSLWSFVTSFQQISSISDLNTSFHDLINVHSRGLRADNPRGQNFDVNRNLLSFRSFATSSKKISLKSDIFHDFIHVYSPGKGADNPLGKKF